ncbi:hypothetical protein CANCADRAFT_55666 [Tortispora caseinolytica NRRL Y-17796]|uniref:Mitochondrial distribution and morphology protein family 31/32 n=1 Tax=Tortispora caseinolytica NRRL Y-17796 TaxID=767744 RepID=A0A1E4TJG2_9ASCO|nr:hypothetical protein CANCADRAFT_55666 [Tortispora caseinolytica NRRL Y-17796]
MLPRSIRTFGLRSEDLLAAASGVWERAKIRFKWLLMRQVRPFNADDISAFFSWIVVGNVLWIILGTTTFASLVVFTLNTVFAQETLARMVGNYLTKETGVTVVFESAIVPNWNENKICLRKVFISRRPGSLKKVLKGSQSTAAAAAATAAATLDPKMDKFHIAANSVEEANYTQFDLTVDTINVTLSFQRWMSGKGIVKDVEVKGVRGVVDRRFVKWIPNVDPRSYRRSHKPGDFEMEHVTVDDLLVTLLQPNDFRPFQVSVFSCDLSHLRKQWLFYDILSANHISGSYDDSLFTIHSRQTVPNGDTLDANSPWSKINRLRIDGVAIDHLNRGITSGPFSWITSGNVDMVADVYLPTEQTGPNLSVLIQDIVEQFEIVQKSRAKNKHSADSNHQHSITMDNYPYNDTTQSDGSVTVTVPEPTSPDKSSPKDKAYVIMDLRVQLNKVRATVPLFTPDLSYVNNAMIRPIVAYINNHESYIPVTGRIVKRLSEFDGSWTIFDSGLMDDLSAEVYDAFAKNATDTEARSRRIKKVGLWSLQMIAQMLLFSLGTIA